jgi:hypothetical protein
MHFSQKPVIEPLGQSVTPSSQPRNLFVKLVADIRIHVDLLSDLIHWGVSAQFYTYSLLPLRILHVSTIISTVIKMRVCVYKLVERLIGLW